jgi:RNA polymerase sigma-70 factor (ECF subfamily)
VATASEPELIDAARRGDAVALSALVTAEQSRVFRFALKMCRLREDAEDVLQDTLLAAVRTFGKYRGDASVSTWLYTIARSFCIKRRRRSKFAPETLLPLDSDAASEAPATERAPDDALAERELASALNEAVAGLAPAYREVLVLRDVEGLPATEVAKVMDLSVQAVKSRLHRARSSVRQTLAPLLGVDQRSRRARGCPDIATLFSRHLEGDISPSVCARMERHLAGCPRCEGICDSLRTTLRLCGSMPTPRVPAPVEEAVRREIRSLLAARANPRGRRPAQTR